MVTPELKWPMTNFTPSAANLLATDTPCFGSARSSPTLERDLLAEDAAGGVDVLDRLLGAVLELRAEGGVAAGDRPPTPILICACAAPAKAPGAAERQCQYQ